MRARHSSPWNADDSSENAFNDNLPPDDDWHDFTNALEEAFATIPAPNKSRMQAHRSAFLTAGIQMATPSPAPTRPRFWRRLRFWWRLRFWRRLLWQTSLLTMFLLISLVGTTLASANSLPGDNLYLMKLGIEQVDGKFRNADEWQQYVEERRRLEVQRLIEKRREAPVIFQGILTRTDQQWRIDSLSLQLTPEQEAYANQVCPNRPVRVIGKVASGRLHLSHLIPTCLQVETVQVVSQEE